MNVADIAIPRRGILRGMLTAGASSLVTKHSATAAGASAPVVRKTVYVWYPRRFGAWNTSGIQWDAITHICFRSVGLRPDGSIATQAGRPPQAFVDEAHSHGVKVCILAWSNNRKDSDSYLANHAERTVDNLVAYVRDNGLDGISYDDEMIHATNSVANGPNRPLVNRFFQKLNQALKSANAEYHLSFAAPPVISSKDRFGSDWFDWPTIAANVDAIVPMLYTANPPQIGWTTNAQPLAGGRPTERTVPRDVVSLMGDYYDAIPDQRPKLLLGINSFPWAGYEFRSKSADPFAVATGRASTQPFEYMEQQAALYGKRWDSRQQSAGYLYQDGEQFVQGWYDDDHSWAAKLDYVNREGLGGVGIWVVDGKDDAAAMWDMLRTAFAMPKRKI